MVTGDRKEAVEATRRGEGVVLIVPFAVEPAPAGAQPGRIAVLVGDPEDPATRAAADAMEAELYGAGAGGPTGTGG